VSSVSSVTRIGRRGAWESGLDIADRRS
jgi:hypothetical protein